MHQDSQAWGGEEAGEGQEKTTFWVAFKLHRATQEAQSPSWVWECLTHGGPAASLHLRMLRELLETRL